MQFPVYNTLIIKSTCGRKRSTVKCQPFTSEAAHSLLNGHGYKAPYYLPFDNGGSLEFRPIMLDPERNTIYLQAVALVHFQGKPLDSRLAHLFNVKAKSKLHTS